MSGEIFFQIGFRVVEGHSVLLQQRVHLKPRSQDRGDASPGLRSRRQK